MGTNEHGFGIASGTLQYTSADVHSFYSGTNNTFTLDNAGNITCVGNITNNSNGHITAGGLRIGGWDAITLYNGARDIGIYAENGKNINLGMWGGNFTIMSINNTGVHFSQRLKYPNSLWNISAGGVYRTYYGLNDISYYCCGSGSAEGHIFMNSSYSHVFKITNAGNASCSASFSCTGIYASGTAIIGDRIGVVNATPWVELNLGSVDVGGSSGAVVFGKNNGGGGIRNFRQGFSSNFFFCIGDCGNVNNSSATWTTTLGISYQAPASALTISSTGQVIMPNGYSSSDERIKTNIKTIENALDKTLLLRGVEYNNFKMEPDKKLLGLIAQEVELIIP